MSESHWTLLTNGLMLVVVIALWLGKRRERLKSEEDAAVRRGRMKHMTLDQLQRGYSVTGHSTHRVG